VAIARSLINKAPFDPNTGPIAEFYRRAILELKERAVQRLVRDKRVLTSEARRARVLIQEATEILAQLEADRSQWIAENVPNAYLRGIRDASLGLKEIGLAPVTSLEPQIHEAAINALIRDLQDDYAATDEQILKGYRRMLRRTQLEALQDKMITERVAQATLQGQGRRELSKDIARRLIDEYGDKPIRVGARNYAADTYAELVARTKTREASTAGTINRVIESGQDLVMVTSHGAKDACGFYEGKVFSVSGTSEKYPGLNELPNGGPPFHPNCIHVLAPFVESLSSGAERRRARGVHPASLGKSYGDVEKMVRKGEIKVPARRRRKAA